ncbi:hypothetical protein JCM8097_008770 [Rhodosporidiobolus ruineniae]
MPSETTALLDEGTEVRTGRKASPRWIIPAYFVFSLLDGATAAIDAEIMTQIACRTVPSPDLPPSPFSSIFTASIGVGDDWAGWCRSSPEVQKRTTELVTSAALAAGICSTLTAAWWGGFSDRRGRKPVFALISAAEVLTATAVILMLTFPETFGSRFFVAGAVVAGLFGGSLTGATTAIAYLGDCSPGAKTQLLSTFEAVNFLGAGLGPMLGPTLMRLTGLDLTAPYAAIIIVRLCFLASLFFMPESLRPVHPKKDDDTAIRAKPSLVERIVALPASLFAPFRILLPQKKDARRDWRLTLIALSFTFFMIVPGIQNVKILYARGKFGWGPEEVGRWMSFGALCRLVVLLGILPLLDRLYKKRKASSEERGSGRVGGKRGDTAFDHAVALRSVLFALVGYIVMSFPTSSSRNFLIGTSLTAFAAATPPALQALVLAFTAPEDAGKALASITALATVSFSTVGPSAFGATYSYGLEHHYEEVVFILGAVWITCAFLPLLFVRPGAREQSEEAAKERRL